MKKILKFMFFMTLTGVFALSFSSCSDDDSNPSVNVEVSEITGTSATISWNVISSEVMNHYVVVKEKESGVVCFDEPAGYSFTNSSPYTEIEVTDLDPETVYAVTVTATTLGAQFDAITVGEGSTEFTTIVGGGSTGDLVSVEKDEIVGTWYNSNRYFKFNDDGTGETGSHSDTFGDEKDDDISWEITTFELDGTEVRSIKATDSEGYWSDLEVVKEDDVIKLIDHDNNWTFEAADNGGDAGTYSQSDFSGSTFKDANETITVNFNADNGFTYFVGGIDMNGGNTYEWKVEESEIKCYKDNDYSFSWHTWVIVDKNTVHLKYSDIMLIRQ